jgi:hypothetical protein
MHVMTMLSEPKDSLVSRQMQVLHSRMKRACIGRAMTALVSLHVQTLNVQQTSNRCKIRGVSKDTFAIAFCG